MKREPFFSSGLNFSCTRCSACCRYDAGVVYLTHEDLEKLLKIMDMDRDSFIAVYCRWVEDWKGRECLSLKEKANKDCILWDNGCTVYTARPVQCRTFPFWENILSSKESWNMAADGCPGINSGRLYNEEEINGFLEISKKEPVIQKGGAA